MGSTEWGEVHCPIFAGVSIFGGCLTSDESFHLSVLSLFVLVNVFAG